MTTKCWMQMSSGSGPEECCCAVGKVYEKIVEDAGKKNIAVSLIHTVPSRIRGNFKSLLVALAGSRSEQFCLHWQGEIQWIWKSQYRPNHKRKNWFVSVEVFTPPKEPEKWRENEIRIETTRSGGPGGQHVNKTESAVRLTHLPTGIMVRADEERSQHMNKRLALARLEALLNQRSEDHRRAENKEMWQCHHRLKRGNSTRVFTGDQFTAVANDHKDKGVL